MSLIKDKTLELYCLQRLCQLKTTGLLTDNVKEKYEQIGVLSYAELEDNFNIDWAEMSKPYETQEEIEKAIRLV